MPPDSPLVLSAIVLFAACAGSWRMAAVLRAPARLPLRFASMLLAALAVAGALHLGDVTALMLLPLAGANLALAALARFARPVHTAASSLVLMAGLACGLAAMLSDHWMLSLVPLALAALAIFAAALNAVSLTPALSGAALLMAGFTLPAGGVTAGTLLLCAAAVIGLSRSAAAVHQQRGPRGDAGIGGVQPGFGLAAVGKGLTQDLRHK